jgi:hypothetical protein
MPRKEHLAWCKTRALEFVDSGDLQNAVASMISDLGKHPETNSSMNSMRAGMHEAGKGDSAAVRRWVEGFN